MKNKKIFLIPMMLFAISGCEWQKQESVPTNKTSDNKQSDVLISDSKEISHESNTDIQSVVPSEEASQSTEYFVDSLENDSIEPTSTESLEPISEDSSDDTSEQPSRVPCSFLQTEIDAMNDHFNFAFEMPKCYGYYFYDYLEESDYFNIIFGEVDETEWSKYKKLFDDTFTFVKDESDEQSLEYTYKFGNFEISLAYYSGLFYANDSNEYDILSVVVFLDQSSAASYQDFDELVESFIGQSIIHIDETSPFLYMDYTDDDEDPCILYYVEGCKESDWTSYKSALDEYYEFRFTETDDDDILWYVYYIDGAEIDAAFYEYEGENCIDVYIYDYFFERGDSDGLVLTIDNLELDSYSTSPTKVAVDGINFEYVNVGSFGDGIQFKKIVEGVYASLYNTTPIDEITGLRFEWSETKSVFQNLNDGIKITVANNAGFTEDKDTYYVDIYKNQTSYVVEFDDSYTFVKIENNSSNALYFESITVIGASSGQEINGNTYTDEMISAQNKGLPQSDSGVYNVNFASNDVLVKDVHGLADYTEGCPTVGSAKVLVIPVEFSDITAASKGYSIEAIKNAFLPKETTNANLPYYSVADYFSISSNGKLTLDITVLDNWFMPENESDYYVDQQISYFGEQLSGGDQIIMDEALKYLDSNGYDLSVFDSDSNGCIDAIVLINTFDIDSSDGAPDIKWAYRYFNFYVDDENNYYEYDGVSANDYLWASYQFLLEDDYGYVGDNPTNTYTFLHEFSHVLGADDYYDTAYVSHPLDGNDIMDSMCCDHSPYTKFLYGWIDSSRLVTTTDTITLELNAFEQTGDTILLANNFDPELGLFQEY